MEPETATNPEAAPEPAPETEVAPEAEAEAEGLQPAPEAEPELDQSTEEPAEPETVEVEINGLKYRVPAALKDGYMLHADYTRKTQEAAEKAKALETERERFTQQAQAHQQHLHDYGELAHVERMLKQFREVDWQRAHQEDPDQAQQLGLQFNALRDQREQIVERIQKRDHEARVTAEREYANRKDQLATALARDIPNYSPDLHGKLVETAKRGGYSEAEVQSVTDPRVFKILHLAQLGEQVLKRQAAAKPPAPDIKPVPKVGTGGTPKPGVHDGLSMEEWVRRESQRMAKKATG